MTHLSGHSVGRGLARIHRVGMGRWGGGQRLTLLRLTPRSGYVRIRVSYCRPGSPGTLCTLCPPGARSCWSPGWRCLDPGTRLWEGSGETWRGAGWSGPWTGRWRKPGGRRTGWPGIRGAAGSWGRDSGSRVSCCGGGRFLCSPRARAGSWAAGRDGTPGYLRRRRCQMQITITEPARGPQTAHFTHQLKVYFTKKQNKKKHVWKSFGDQEVMAQRQVYPYPNYAQLLCYEMWKMERTKRADLLCGGGGYLWTARTEFP